MDDVLKITHRFGETFDVPSASKYLFGARLTVSVYYVAYATM